MFMTRRSCASAALVWELDNDENNDADAAPCRGWRTRPPDPAPQVARRPRAAAAQEGWARARRRVEETAMDAAKVFARVFSGLPPLPSSWRCRRFWTVGFHVRPIHVGPERYKARPIVVGLELDRGWHVGHSFLGHTPTRRRGKDLGRQTARPFYSSGNMEPKRPGQLRHLLPTPAAAAVAPARGCRVAASSRHHAGLRPLLPYADHLPSPLVRKVY